MSDCRDVYRALFRAARDLYLACRSERVRLESAPAPIGERLWPEPDYSGRLGRALAREAAMRSASVALVRHIETDPAGREAL